MSEMKKRRDITPGDIPIRCIQTGMIYPDKKTCCALESISSSVLGQILRGEKKHYKGRSYKFVIFED